MRRFWAWCKEVVNGFLANKCSIHAAGLTYFALLAVVPVLCCILVVAKACGVDHYAKNQINAKIDTMISNVEHGQDENVSWMPMFEDEEREKKRMVALEFGKQARSISNAIFERVDQFDVGTLGWIGFGLLLWTVISSLGTVEVSFNQIWGVQKPRPIWKRAYMYLFIIVVLPILSAIAMSLPILNVVKDVVVATMGATWLTKIVSDGVVWLIDSWLFRLAFSLASASIAFGFFFWVMPNCKVNFRKAWYGGIITAVLFGGWIKLCAIAQVGIAKSSALYGSFAFLPIVLAWMYMSWQIILLGANMVRTFEK